MQDGSTSDMRQDYQQEEEEAESSGHSLLLPWGPRQFANGISADPCLAGKQRLAPHAEKDFQATGQETRWISASSWRQRLRFPTDPILPAQLLGALRQAKCPRSSVVFKHTASTTSNSYRWPRQNETSGTTFMLPMRFCLKKRPLAWAAAGSPRLHAQAPWCRMLFTRKPVVGQKLMTGSPLMRPCGRRCPLNEGIYDSTMHRHGTSRGRVLNGEDSPHALAATIAQS